MLKPVKIRVYKIVNSYKSWVYSEKASTTVFVKIGTNPLKISYLLYTKFHTHKSFITFELRYSKNQI